MSVACDFIQNPAALWNSDLFEDKRRVLNLAFIGILPYDKELGFGTVTFALLFELFRACEVYKSNMVVLAGIPACRQAGNLHLLTLENLSKVETKYGGPGGN